MANWMSIDFGTSSSVAAIIRNRQPELATPLDCDATGSKIFPTVVYLESNGNISACHDAERMKDFDCSRFLREFKFDIHGGVIPDLCVSYTAIVAAVLKVLKNAAEKSLDDPVENVILTLPATWHGDGVQQQVMLAAAREAGFKQTELIKEAQAAAIYYDFIEQNAQGYSLIYDLGGGTFDAAIIKHTGSDYQLVGNSSGLAIGGKFFTEKITEHYLTRTGINIDYSDSASLEAILSKCEKIKRHLSNKENGEFPVSHQQNYTITRRDFESMISEYIDKTLQACEKLTNVAGVKWEELNRVLLIGGSCNIPLVQTKIKKYLQSLNMGNAHVVWRRTESGKSMDPQFAVALGAAVYAVRNFMPLPKPPVHIGVLKRCSNGQIYRLKEGVNTFGRETTLMDFSFPEDGKMSSSHFSIEVIKHGDAYEYLLTDLGSKGGTVVGNMSLTDKYAFASQQASLTGGEKIVAGNTKFKFII